MAENTIDKHKIFQDFENNVNEIIKCRNNPLLIMFYSDPAGKILPCDIEILEDVFDDYLKKKQKDKIKHLDLMIQTNGGEAHTSYRLIQLIRSYCDELSVLVPTHAYSGGTLITFGANRILMGRSAALSPIDVQIGSPEETIALLSIQKYIEFLNDCSQTYKLNKEKNKTHFLTELTKKLVEEVGTIQLGELFRLTSLAQLHSKTLLHNYMFKNDSQKLRIADEIVSKFTKESPTHAFEMDYTLVAESGLKVDKLEGKIYIPSKQVIDLCAKLKRGGAICPFFPNSKDLRIPYFHIFDGEVEVKKDDKK